MRYYVPTHLSERIHETPEGYLLCLGVAIARTGTLEYAASDVPEDVADGRDMVLVHRDEEEVFAPATIASFEGKPVTIDHPEDFVFPENWRDEAKGHVQHVRRGAGSEADLLLADLLIMDADAINLVLGGLRELSCGYDADTEPISPGVGRQKSIIGNHVALVRKGRCGSRCAIRDKQQEDVMSKQKKSIWERFFARPDVRKAMRDAEEELKKEGTAGQDGEQPQAQPASDDGGDIVMQALDEIKLLLRTLVEHAQPKAQDNDDTPRADSDILGDGEPSEPGEHADDDPQKDTR